MDVFDTINLWDVHYKFLNDTEHGLDGTILRSDTGFILNYKRQRRLDEVNWINTIRRLGFNEPPYNMGRYLERETDITELDIQNLHVGKPYVLNFNWARRWYGFAFDGSKYLLQDNQEHMYLPDVMF